jgi:hypothetical protein
LACGHQKVRPANFDLPAQLPSGRMFRLPQEVHLALIFCFLVISGASFGQDMPNFCAYHRCAAGDVVATNASEGSPAAACPTKNLSRYVNYSLTAATFGFTEHNVTGEEARLFEKMREDAGVSSYRQAASQCWPLKTGERVTILEYSDYGMVKVSPVRGGNSYWTSANHLDRR